MQVAPCMSARSVMRLLQKCCPSESLTSKGTPETPHEWQAEGGPLCELPTTAATAATGEESFVGVTWTKASTYPRGYADHRRELRTSPRVPSTPAPTVS